MQDYLNEIATNIGQDGENDPNANVYANTNYISNGQNRKQAIESLDLAALLIQNNVDTLNNAFNQYLQDGSFKIRGYISDNAYETANGAPSGGEIYYNTTTGFIRYYNGIDLNWGDVGKTVLGIQETPTGVVDGVNTSFDIANLPLNNEALNVFVNGLIVPKSKYSFTSPTITFNTAPFLGQTVYVSYLSEGNPSTPVISAGTNNVIYYSVSGADVTAKQFILPSTPSTPSHVLVDVVGGSTIRFGTDFTIAGNVFDWDGLTLDGIISAGDIFRIQFFN